MWPGGRHSNDSEDFRAVQVVPTADEVAPGVRPPFLPQADGSDQFLGWQVRNIPRGSFPCLHIPSFLRARTFAWAPALAHVPSSTAACEFSLL